MFNTFNWEFEEDPTDPSDGEKPKSGRRLWVRRGLLLLVVAFVAGLALRVWLTHHRKILREAEAQVRAAVELELKTIAAGDTELFRNRQDPNDSAWRVQQVARYASSVAERFAPAPGLVPVGDYEIKQVHLAGRRARVEVARSFQYRPEAYSELGERQAGKSSLASPVLRFDTTWFYRQTGDGIWYHVAPDEGYEGRGYEWHHDWLVIRASERESDLLRPIAGHLVRLVIRTCAWLPCTENKHYTLQFADVPAPQIQGDLLLLPALYLSGVPRDDLARTAWQYALERWLVDALVESDVGARFLDERLLYQHLVARLKSILGLVSPPTADLSVLARAVAAGEQHSVQELWVAEYDPADPQGRLLESEVAVFLDLLTERVGQGRLFELLPRLRNPYHDIHTALYLTYGLGAQDIADQWYTYLSQLTGQVVTRPETPNWEGAGQPPAPQGP